MLALLAALLLAGAAAYLIAAPTPAHTVLGKRQSDMLLDRNFNMTQISLESGGTAVQYYAYLASTTAQQQEGYMNVTTVGDCGNRGECIGMLFVFNRTSNLCFWMENTALPLRQSWINYSGRVVYSTDAVPYSTNVICHNGMYVLETYANTTVNGTVGIIGAR